MDKVEVKLLSDGKPVPVHLFTEYFFMLRACYVLALEQVHFELEYEEEGDVAIAAMTVEDVVAFILSRPASLTSDELNNLANRKLAPDDELFIDDICRENPFEIVFMGIGIALTAALIVSGGKFEFGLKKIKIEIPALGEGIAKLRKALKSSKTK